MTEKDAHQRPDEKVPVSAEAQKLGLLDVPIAPILSDLVTFADELNTRNINETIANAKYRQAQLRWQRAYVIVAAMLAALTLGIIFSIYRVFTRLAATAENEARIVAAQAAMLDKQRTMAESAVTVMKEQAAEQAAADRPVVVANGIVPARLGKIPQSWAQIETQGVPPKNVAVSWHNFGNTIATDFVQKGQLMLVKAGDPPPTDPECNELHRPEKKTNGTALAPDNTMSAVWSAARASNLADANDSQIYAVGCAYYDGLGKGRFFSDVCLVWLPNQQPEFQPCQDPNRNYIH
jgi:hypothetical protein